MNRIFALTVCCLLTYSVAFGKTKTQASGSSGGSSTSWWVGVATDVTMTRSNFVPALSVLMGFSEKFAVQTYASILSTSPFNCGFGANAKYSVIGNVNKGVHLGGGVGLGTTQSVTSNSAFFIDFNAGGGLHFPFVENVMFSLDAGMSVMVTSSGGTTQLVLGGASPALGLSILYHI